DVFPRGSFARGAAPSGAEDLVGTVWEWCESPFLPFPGFVPQAYAEYSAPWFDGRHRVARGGSYCSEPEIARSCFRNWYLPELRQPVLGVRLAK
ncbi:MAG TPA: SUMF1/EgtB/PvdO family nonheme iron enzyme, partial [Polyangiaceae bacterium]